jgi:hypothetical protein
MNLEFDGTCEQLIGGTPGLCAPDIVAAKYYPVKACAWAFLGYFKQCATAPDLDVVAVCPNAEDAWGFDGA